MIEPHVMHEFGVIGLMLGCGLISVALFVWLYESDSELRRRILEFVHRPVVEILIIMACVGTVVQTGATKGPRGAPRRAIAPPVSTELPSVGESSAAGTDMFPAYTNTVTNVIATGVMPLSDCVVLRAHRPIWTDPTEADFEVYAKTNLQSDVWCGVGKAKMSVDGCGTLISLPYSDLPGGMADTMFFVIGLTVDTDDDGLSDSFESLVSGTDPASSDTDGDGMPDGREVLLGTDPLVNDMAADPDADGISNYWELFNGTDPHEEDTDGDMLGDRYECGWYEEGVTNIPWFAVQPIVTYVPSDTVDRALVGCAMPFTNRLAGSVVDLALADVNGVVYFGRADTTNGISSANSGCDLSVANERRCATVAGYWSDLEMRPAQSSSVTFGTATLNATNYFVVQYQNIGTCSGNGSSISMQISVPEGRADVVYVRYGAVVDVRSWGCVSIGAQGAKVGDFANSPCLGCCYESTPPVIESEMTQAFHFGSGGNPSLRDTDGDGLDDRVEYVIGTDPRRTDTDGDGYGDGKEIECGMSPTSAFGADGAEGDFDGDGIVNTLEKKFGTLLNVADCDNDGLSDGTETGYIVVSNDLPWLAFDRFEDCTTELVYDTNYRYYVNRDLPCALSVQDELVTSATFTSRGWLYLNKAGSEDKRRSDGAMDFSVAIDNDVFAISAYGDSSLFVAPVSAGGSTVVRFGTATHDGSGYVVLEYDNLYRMLSSHGTNSVSFQIAIPTNCPDRAFIRYRDLAGEYMDGRNCGIGMQTFDGKWLHSYCYRSSGMVYDGLGLCFMFGRNTDPLQRDSDRDGIADGDEVEQGTSPNHVDTDGDGMPDGWELECLLDPRIADGEDGAWGDADGDGLPNGKEYEYKTDPLRVDSDGDGLLDGREVADVFEDPTLPWVTLDSPVDLTAAFTDVWECVTYELPSPVVVQQESVSNITLDANGVIYINRPGYVTQRSAASGRSLDNEIDGDCVVIAPYWSYLGFANRIGPSSIRVGTAYVGTNECVIVEYANMYYDPDWEYETNAISFQVSIPKSGAGHIGVKYMNPVGERMNGCNAVIGFQTLGFCSRCEYCCYDCDKISDGMGLMLILGCGSDPRRVDTDRDGISDSEEVNERGTNPCAADSDGDGIDDGAEIAIGTSPVDDDSDGDGMDDGWERDHGLDPLVSYGDDGADGDPDDDGLPNAYELWYGGDPNSRDADGDGVDDYREVMILMTEAGVADTDGDGLSDGEEDTLGTDPCCGDSDGDGLGDGWEHSNGFNPLSSISMSSEAYLDPDGDGLTNLQEMMKGTNPLLSDTDGDGLSDSAELTLGTDPVKADTDGDGLDDGYEVDADGLDPLRPDSDRDGMLDGWEVANGLCPTSAADAAGDLDVDGLSNLDEYRNHSNPRMFDTDGDRIGDGIEVANGSDPADMSDCGIPPSDDCLREVTFDITGDFAAWELAIEGLGPYDRRIIYLTMGTPGSEALMAVKLRKSNSYRLTTRWLNCDGHDDSSAPWYCWQAKIDGKPSAQTYESYSAERKSGVANVVVGTGWIAENEDGLLTDHVCENCESAGNVAEGKTAILHVFDIGHDTLFETDNKCNRIRNDTLKDDSSRNFDGETMVLGGKRCSFAAHRNFLYVAASADNRIRVTERVKVDDRMRSVLAEYTDRFVCAAFRNGELIEESQALISPTNHEAALDFEGSDDEVAEELQIRVGIDGNRNGRLELDESTPLEACKVSGKPAYATVKAISKSKYDDHKAEVNAMVHYKILHLIPDDPPNLVVPHARSFLKLFYEEGSANLLEERFRPTCSSSANIDAFSSDCSCFAEWLTHNCGAAFSDDGIATIPAYRWDENSEVSNFLSLCRPFALKKSMIVSNRLCEYATETGMRLRHFYDSVVKPEAEIEMRLQDVDEVTMPNREGWYEQSALIAYHVFESKSPSASATWVPGITLDFGISSSFSGYGAGATELALANGALREFDAHGTIGRGRVIDPKYRFVVRKIILPDGRAQLVVTKVDFACAVEDLYDFNYEDGSPSPHAAALQIGYRNGNGRNCGRIYRHHIEISTSYSHPFSYLPNY